MFGCKIVHVPNPAFDDSSVPGFIFPHPLKVLTELQCLCWSTHYILLSTSYGVSFYWLQTGTYLNLYAFKNNCTQPMFKLYKTEKHLIQPIFNLYFKNQKASYTTYFQFVWNRKASYTTWIYICIKSKSILYKSIF